MSIYLTSDNHLLIDCGKIIAEDHLRRMIGLIDLVITRDADFIDHETVQDVLYLLLDMLPNEEQMEKALST